MIGEAGRQQLDPQVTQASQPLDLGGDAAVEDLLEDLAELDAAAPRTPASASGSKRSGAKGSLRRHGRPVCHGLVRAAVAVLSLSLLACAGRSGWTVSEARSCGERASPRVCVIAEPDYGHVLELGDAVALPGECVVGEDRGGGLLRVESRSPRDDTRARWLSVRRGKVTVVAIERDGAFEVDRRRCDGRPVSLGER